MSNFFVPQKDVRLGLDVCHKDLHDCLSNAHAGLSVYRGRYAAAVERCDEGLGKPRWPTVSFSGLLCVTVSAPQ